LAQVGVVGPFVRAGGLRLAAEDGGQLLLQGRRAFALPHARGQACRLQEAFAAHLRHVGRVYPRERYPRVVLAIDNAPWHRGQPINEALRDNPHLEFKRLPSYSPRLNPIERFWKKLRRRATHKRLFDTLADLKASLRASLCYFQTMRPKVKSILEGRPRKKTVK
jgi:hypothetical protein